MENNVCAKKIQQVKQKKHLPVKFNLTKSLFNHFVKKMHYKGQNIKNHFVKRSSENGDR
jgi:hypothetical protein